MAAWLNPPTVCERLETIVRRSGGAMMIRDDGGAVEYGLPANATEEMRAFLSGQSRIVFKHGFSARLPGGRVFGSGNVLSPDGRSIARDVSEDFGKPFDDHWLLTYPRIRPAQVMGGTTAVIATTQGVGYSHWLLEELPRLLASDLTACDALLANVRERFAAEALKHHGFPGRILPVRRDHHIQCEQLVVPSLSGPAGWPSADTVRRLREFVAGLPSGGGAGGFGERIYVSRSQAKRRRVVNEGVLYAELEGRGFRKVFLEDLTWAEQISVFREARVVVGAHGAGMANLVFCGAGTRVVELFNRAYVNPCYWRLAVLAGLDYWPVETAGDAALAQDMRANKNDLEAYLPQVLRALG